MQHLGVLGLGDHIAGHDKMWVFEGDKPYAAGNLPVCIGEVVESL